ncbi:bifunctional 5,10-methylenetetrahydrofolate dehydrogenase/5,10-methenyltetrahydrofolate cyclohydrolase [Alicyclobacillus tolerans]|uniref:bifunctional 5,10-methylenetetrahydrofolate dehydrogenase/5,10-methenyltetrahydrofolate cyclohydrolase n=1 Tax=Alicyclobacillus tolerans TaxID=90970 RepID=UPI003B75DB6A
MAHLLYGKPVADQMKQQIREQVNSLSHRHIQVKMVAALVEGDAASLCYARSKVRMAEKLGIECMLHIFPARVTEQRVIEQIHAWNQDHTIHGIILELPLPHHLESWRILQEIDPFKDIDGLTEKNALANMLGTPGIYPATPLACLKMLDHYGVPLRKRNVTLVGCGRTVGMPLLHQLIRRGATVTACHAETRDIGEHLQRAEIAFIAVGKAGLIQPEMCHPGLIIIDAGINQDKNGQIAGDTAPEVAEVVHALTPTPGGVGSVTTMQIFANLLEAVEYQYSLMVHPTS